MRELTNVAVERCIFHLVAPNAEKLTLSEAIPPLTAHQAEFLASHVAGGLKDPQATAARFIVSGPERVQGLSESLHSDNGDLVVASQKMARLLFQASRDDRRVKDGTFAVIECAATSGAGSVRFLALLKLDPASGFRSIETTDNTGKRVISLAEEPNILPGKQERLQKCAFIRPFRAEEEYQLLVVDHQARTVADFFILDFLGAEFALDNAERTRRLRTVLRDSRNSIAPTLDAANVKALDDAIRGVMASERVNLDTVLTSLPVPETARAQVRRAVDQILPDRQFVLAGAPGQPVKRLMFEADNGLRVSVPADFFNEMVDVQDIPGTQPQRRRIVITTTKWNSV